METVLFLPQIRMTIPDVVRRAQAAEHAGFDGIAFMDHLVAPMAEHQPVWEAMTLATWVAARTERLRISHLVLCDAMRHPAVLAKQAVTLDHASGGRFELALGWGSWPSELVDFGVTDSPPRERALRLHEDLQTIRDLWAGDRLQPGPLGRIPIVVGGAGPLALAAAREHADWWNLPATDLPKLPELLPQVGSARASVQQMLSLIGPGQDREEVVALGRKRFGHLGEGLIVGDPEEVTGKLLGLKAQGVERVYVWFTDFAALPTLELFGREVIPAL